MTDEVFACLSDHCYCSICCWSLSDHCYCGICLLLESVRPLLLCYLSVAGVCQTIVTVLFVAGVCQTIVTVLPVCCWSLSDHCYCVICLLLESVRPLLRCYLSVAGVLAHGLIIHGIERAAREAGEECEAVKRSVKQ